MQIETYEIEEIKSSDASTMAADSEAIELCKKLGLEGQIRLTDPETDTRFPYPKMSARQNLVFSTLFPEVTKLEQFGSGIIPLRVLQVAAFCKEQPTIHHMRVWHTADIRKDPILIGYTSDYASEHYLLARWGDALEDFEVLAQRAVSTIKANLDAKLEEIKRKCEARMGGTQVEAVQAALTGNLSMPCLIV